MKFQKRNVIITPIRSYVIHDIDHNFLILIPIERGVMSKNTTLRNTSLFKSLIEPKNSRISLNKVYSLRVTKDIMKKALALKRESMPRLYIPLTKDRYKDFYKTCCQHDHVTENLIIKIICNTEHLYARVLTYKRIIKDKIPTLGLALYIL